MPTIPPDARRVAARELLATEMGPPRNSAPRNNAPDYCDTRDLGNKAHSATAFTATGYHFLAISKRRRCNKAAKKAWRYYQRHAPYLNSTYALKGISAITPMLYRPDKGEPLDLRISPATGAPPGVHDYARIADNVFAKIERKLRGYLIPWK